MHLGPELARAGSFCPCTAIKISIATGAKNQTYEAIGMQYAAHPARSHVDVELRLTNAQG